MSIFSLPTDHYAIFLLVEPTLVFLILSPIIGSFLGVLIRRIPLSQPFMVVRSECETCLKPLRPWEMIPVFSYLYQKGRCQNCKAKIAPFHLHIELAAPIVPAFVAVASFWTYSPLYSYAYLAWSCLLGWVLLALIWIDIRHFRLPDILTLPLLLAGLANGLWLELATADNFHIYGDILTERLAGCLLGWGFLTALAKLYKHVRGRTGLGAGDIKLVAAGGAWLGLNALPATIFCAAILGILHVVARHLYQRHASWSQAIPFGPALALSIWLIYLISPHSL
ncbi:prepilin peptidase [Neokomagataea tanensis]|uniref:Prepilin leader peptidase/N-methyltransferase n=1 Tax=Neokomagataea tanensis TaxID=661191 RepID=A0A4Y6V8W2_9PROT|nr:MULTISPECIES: A24 family peptidase [Neokomagataea]QDH25318.1 prepilin peptidase [Neokomagataea tanensis]